MIRSFTILFFLAAAVASAAAQPAGPGPGPNPWVVTGPQIYYNGGCVTVPSTVSGGCKGLGTINATALYINGSSLLSSSSIAGGSAGNLAYYAASGSALSPFVLGANVPAALQSALNGSGGLVSIASTLPSTFTSSSLTSFGLQSANSVLGNSTASSAGPIAQAMPSCSTSTSAIIWTTNTGFGCHSITAGSAAAGTLTGTTLAGNVVNASITNDTLGVGSSQVLTVGSANTGFSNRVVVSNSGTSTNFATTVLTGATLGCSSCDVEFGVNGGTSPFPQGVLYSDSGVTDGLSITSLSGNIVVSAASSLNLNGTTGVFAPTPSFGTNNTQVATTAFTQAAVAIPTNRTLYATDYGVTCDGSTDDAAALNTFHAAIANNTKAVYPTNGQCVFKSALNAINGSLINIVLDFSGSIFIYEGAATTGNLFTMGGGGVCSNSRWRVDNFQLYSTTVMTAGYGLYIDNVCAINMFYTRVGTFTSDLYNAIYAQGTQFLYAFSFVGTASNVGCSFSGNAGTEANQSTDTFIYTGYCGNSTIGLLLGGNVGGFYADAVDAYQNNLNVRIDQSLVAVCNQQIAFGPEFASDATSGGANGGVSIHDAGCSGGGGVTDIFFHQSWVSTAADNCMVIDTGVTVNLHLDQVRMSYCGVAGLVNNSSTSNIMINGGEWHNDGVALDNAGNGPIKVQTYPTMYGNSTDMLGMAPVISSCGTSPTQNSASTDDFGSFIVGSGATSCVMTFVTPWHSIQGAQVSTNGVSGSPFVNALSSTAVTFGGLTAGGLYTYSFRGLH